MSAQRRLWSDRADAQADLSLRWAHSHFVGFVMRRLKYLLFRRLQNNHIFFIENSEIHWLFSFLPYIPDWNKNSLTFPLGKKINKCLVSGNISIFFNSVRLTLKKKSVWRHPTNPEKCPYPKTFIGHQEEDFFFISSVKIQFLYFI